MEIYAVGTPVKVTNSITKVSFTGTVTENAQVSFQAGALRGWYVVTDASGKGWDCLPSVTRATVPYCRQHGANSTCGPICAARYQR